MSGTLKLSGGVEVGRLASDPANPQKGLIYYNTTFDELRHYNGTSFVQISSQDELDDILGTLDASPSNYTPTGATHSGHLEGIDTALATAGAVEFADDVFRVKGSLDATKKVALEVDGLTTATTRTITMPDTNVDLADIATNTAKVSADGLVTTHSDVSNAGSGIIISASERTKLNGIETLADVTDATNVEAAGAVMESDTTTAAMGFVIDEDDMVSDLATKVPTQQSVKAFVESSIASEVTYKGGYNAATNTPDLDSTPIATAIGDMYTVTAAGTFFTATVEIGDVIIAEIVNATVEADWTIIQKNLDAASIKTSYESNADTNAFTDAEQTTVGNQSGTNTGDEPAASTSVVGVVELATVAEVDAGADTTRAVTAASLATIQTDVDANTAKVGYTAAQAKADVVNDAIANGNLDTAPSENAVFDALALKLANVSEDTTPSLGGDLTLGAYVVIHDGDSMKRGSSASDFLEEEYIHSIALAASQTATVIADLTFAHASFEGFIMDYKVKETTSNDIRIGTLRVTTNGTGIVFNDLATETAETGIVFSAAINGANIEVKFDSGSNGATLRADVKRIKA